MMKDRGKLLKIFHNVFQVHPLYFWIFYAVFFLMALIYLDNITIPVYKSYSGTITKDSDYGLLFASQEAIEESCSDYAYLYDNSNNKRIRVKIVQISNFNYLLEINNDNLILHDEEILYLDVPIKKTSLLMSLGRG
ncbi:hypothetical protein C0033_10525 [Clostridium sp. chh4-2]|uniref:hypothetical protein n=1 Tax=Clostridium sp. chh4-2 TaxID=2067550 RepID=UPI000CCDBF55|nr:hypothetical protein [Clostridium sp. chh4-2]PNV62080.1 hypothetical protein C0033_10525 [Clostridium sp. chh4-2]